MGQILDFIFINGDGNELTASSLLCLFIFLSILECISAVVREAVKGAGM